VNVAYADLSVIEKRAVDMIIGKRRRLRVTRNDPATKLAKAIRGEWLRSVPPFREKEAARTLTTETIVRAVLPILDALANGPIRGGTPDNDYDPAKMEPAALGALVAIARMSHPHAGFEHICDVIQKSRRMAREAIT
jgi:hypothetical protein